jgi:hypothetical protein
MSEMGLPFPADVRLAGNIESAKRYTASTILMIC